MYKVLIFRGGVYKFDLLEEYVEDLGGLILPENRFSVSRGDYHISEQIIVTIIVPKEDIRQLQDLVYEIKGEIEDANLKEDQHIQILNLLHVYHILSQNSKKGLNIEEIKKLIEEPCELIMEKGNCPPKNVENVLDELFNRKILEKKGSQYRIKGENND